MSENIQSIANGTYTIGETNKLTFSAGPGIKIDEPSAGTVRIGNDETVLWETSNLYGESACNLSESLHNFEYIGILPARTTSTGSNIGGSGPYLYYQSSAIVGGSTEPHYNICPFFVEYVFWKCSQYTANNDCTNLTWYKGYYTNMTAGTAQNEATFTKSVAGIRKIIGINRKEV